MDKTVNGAVPQQHQGSGASFIDKFKNFSSRAFIHCAALVLGALVEGSTSIPPAQNGLVMMCVYTGIVCIFARGMAPTPQWLVPATVGAAQFLFFFYLLYLYWNIPFYYAVLLGGAQAWVQRFFIKGIKGMGSECFMLFLILICTVNIFEYIEPAAKINAILIWFTVFAALGKFAYNIILSLPEKKRIAAENAAAAKEISASRQNISNSEQKISDPKQKISDFKKMAKGLLAKAPSLAESEQRAIEEICADTGKILLCMEEDQRDFEPGCKFLNRYLPAAHSIVDKHIMLCQKNINDERMLQTIDRGRELLDRLRAAFANEHKMLLQNDLMDFSAELDVLDSLLKMRGN